ncbi:MAG TPA: TIGR03435 family protein [Bryobacteraceae bacterium]|nr:TIGR03435 family protein [Bryobacteraceae bacterium]
MMIRMVAAALAAGSLFAQAGFEAISIRPADPAARGQTIHGGPGSSDAGLVTMRNIDLFALVAMAYGLHPYQLSAPDWLKSAHFDISARVPQGIDVDQYRELLQSMLAERFHLAVHHESREMRIYDLVAAKSGAKVKPSPNPSAAGDGLQPPALAGGPPPGYHGPVALRFPALSMPRFADYLSGFLDAPVNDATGLPGDYEIRLQMLPGATPSESAADNAPQTVFDALPEQLGLLLVARRAQVDVVVVDGMDKSPTEN